ncbi:MAG: TolC family protein [Acidobacteriota bacterium]
MTKRFDRRLLPILFLPAVLLTGTAAAADDPVRIGVVFDGEAEVTHQLLEQIETEILTLTEGEFDVRFEDRDILAGDWTTTTINASVDTLLKDPEVDLVLALGVVASHTFCCREDLPKPVIAGFVIDAALQDLPQSDGASGVKNLNYLAFPSSFERDIDVFREIVPFRKMTVVFNRWFVNVVPEFALQIGRLAAARGLDFQIVSVGDSVDEALAEIGDDTEAVYLAPLLHLPDEDRQRFIDQITARRIPSFSLFGIAEVQRGVLAAQRDDAFYDRLARRIALNVQRILLGEDAGTIPVTIPDRQRLAINMETARSIMVFPPWHMLTEAELINEAPQNLRLLTIREAVRAAVAANLDIAARQRGVAAGEQNIARARSALRPQLEVGLSGVQIDNDRASSPFAVQAERTWTGGLTLTQLIYSEPALANVQIQGYAQLTREQELEQLRLDIAQEAMVTYMNVLLAQTVEEILKSNLEVSRSNLELARVRRSVGYAGPGEVFRWESEVATARRDLVDARAETFQARIALNRLMHQPMEDGYQTQAITLEEVFQAPLAVPIGESRADEPILFRSRQQVLPFIGTPLHFDIFRQFMVDEGLSRAPELAQLDAAIEAQKRVIESARRAFRLPEVALQAQVDEVLDRGGDGADLLSAAEDTSWSIGVQATLPLYTGGSRRADEVEAEEALAELELQRAALSERLEQLIRSNLYVTNASFSGIQLTQEAADAARKNLELVTDAYSQGAVNVLDLLDAQSASLSADLAAASALFQFFIDLINVERSVNWFEFEHPPEEQAEWFDRLEKYFDENGLEPRAVRGGLVDRAGSSWMGQARDDDAANRAAEPGEEGQ